MLGLLPTLLSTIAPSIPEMALLSSYRPMLSFILSLGAPVIWPSRIFEYSDPQNAIILEDAKPLIPPRKAWLAAEISLFQYLSSGLSGRLLLISLLC